MFSGLTNQVTSWMGKKEEGAEGEGLTGDLSTSNVDPSINPSDGTALIDDNAAALGGAGRYTDFIFITFFLLSLKYYEIRILVGN